MLLLRIIAVIHALSLTSSEAFRSWVANAGMAYGSFFAKLTEPGEANARNFDLGVLTFLIGLAFFVSLAGMIATILLPAKSG